MGTLQDQRVSQSQGGLFLKRRSEQGYAHQPACHHCCVPGTKHTAVSVLNTVFVELLVNFSLFGKPGLKSNGLGKRVAGASGITRDTPYIQSTIARLIPDHTLPTFLRVFLSSGTWWDRTHREGGSALAADKDWGSPGMNWPSQEKIHTVGSLSKRLLSYPVKRAPTVMSQFLVEN